MSLLFCLFFTEAEKLSRDIKKLFRDGKKHDLTLRVGNKDFQVHQEILMARCKVFEAMLTHDMIEKRNGIIDLPDCEPKAIEQFLTYVYSGKVEKIDEENAYGLYYVADKYSIEYVKEKCKDFIIKSFSPLKICEVFDLAKKHSDEKLLKRATGYFLRHIHDIVFTEEWESFANSDPDFTNGLLTIACENLHDFVMLRNATVESEFVRLKV